MNYKIFLFLLLFFVLFFVMNDSWQKQPGVNSESNHMFRAKNVENDELSNATSGKVVFLAAKKWAFEPPTIQMKFGETMVFQIESIDVSGSFVMPSFGISEELTPGKLSYIEVTPKQPGAYVFFYAEYPIVKGVLTVRQP